MSGLVLPPIDAIVEMHLDLIEEHGGKTYGPDPLDAA